MPCDLRLRVALGFGVAGAEVAVGVDVVADDDAGVDVDDDAVEEAADVARAGVVSEVDADGITGVVARTAATMVVVGGDSLVVFLAAGVALALVLVAVLAFLTGLSADLALGFSLGLGRLAWGLALGWRVGAGVLRLDLMGCVCRGLRGLFVTLSQCHGPAWELINRCPQGIHRQFRLTLVGLQ